MDSTRWSPVRAAKSQLRLLNRICNEVAREKLSWGVQNKRKNQIDGESGQLLALEQQGVWSSIFLAL